MADEKQSEGKSVEGKVTIDLDSLKYWSKIDLPIAPVAAVFALAEGWLLSVKDISPHVLIALLGAGVAVTLIWNVKDILAGRSDFVAFLDVHGIFDPIDRDAQEEIHKGLQELRFIEEPVEKIASTTAVMEETIEYLTCRAINDIAVQALTPSAYHNHHGKELAEYGATEYIERKKQIVHRAFSMAPLGYRQMVINKLSDGMVDLYVRRWIRDKVILVMKTACRRKIDYYEKLSARKGFSQGFRAKILEWETKNRNYVTKLNELYGKIS